MELIQAFLTNFWILTNDMAIYILIGVLFAGVLKQLIPENFVSKHLGKDNFGSVVKSSLFGIPLPLCSCSVIPFATGLKKEGASSGSVLSFLISTPITGADSILATYGFFGWIFTIYRVVTSLVIAMVAGILQNFWGQVPDTGEEETCTSCGCTDTCGTDTETQSGGFSAVKALNYALFDIFRDFAKPLFWGLVLGALITTFMPKDIMQYLGDNLLLTYLLILFFSMPLYICATASLPIAASLIASGLSGGAAFILLSAGPATNSVTMGVVYKVLGKKALIIYLGVIGLFSLLFGYMFDLFFPNILSAQLTEHLEEFGFIAQLSAVTMLGLMLYFLLEPLFNKKTHTKENTMATTTFTPNTTAQESCCSGNDTTPSCDTAPAEKEANSKKVLVLCTGNSCRSIIAEAIINKELEGIEAYSSGVAPSGRVNPYAKKVLEAHDAWDDAYHSKTLDEVMEHDFNLVVTVCDHAKETCPMFPKPVPKIHAGFEDPDGKGYDAFEKTYEEIHTTLLPRVKAILNGEVENLSDDERICYCIGITKGEIVAAVRAGASTLDEVKKATKACTGSDCKHTNPLKRCCSKEIKKLIALESPGASMKKNVFKTQEGVNIAFTGAVAKQQIDMMVQNCSTGKCECMSDETKEKISHIEVEGKDGNVEMKLTGDIDTAEIEEALAKSKVLNKK